MGRRIMSEILKGFMRLIISCRIQRLVELIRMVSSPITSNLTSFCPKTGPHISMSQRIRILIGQGGKLRIRLNRKCINRCLRMPFPPMINLVIYRAQILI